MAIVNIKIRNNVYQLSCGEGEEHRLLALAEKLNNKVNELATKLPRSNDLMLMVMAGLLLEDKVEELENQVKNLISKTPIQPKEAVNEDAVSDSVEIIAEYIENLALKLDKIYNQ
ncbi:MAG: cell division protein ZapA [Sphingobacteriia bacterium]|nr:cell division protein ZapA [Sphingobacteriia bacterium]